MKRSVFLFVSIALVMLSSCESRKNFVYLQDMFPNIKYPAGSQPEAVIQPDDRLDITVSCKNSELAVPFNTTGGYTINSGNVPTSETKTQEKGYRVDRSGNIQFPVLGVLHVQGLTISQISDVIKKQIISGNYMQDPGVSVELLNFKIYMLGAISHVGPITVDGDHINMLELLSTAGDLQQNAKIDRVMVIRTVNNTRKMYAVDPRSMDIYNSPVFNLRQNDIVYVEPKYRSMNKEDQVLKQIGVITAISSIISAAALIGYLLK